MVGIIAQMLGWKPRLNAKPPPLPTLSEAEAVRIARIAGLPGKIIASEDDVRERIRAMRVEVAKRNTAAALKRDAEKA